MSPGPLLLSLGWWERTRAEGSITARREEARAGGREGSEGEGERKRKKSTWHVRVLVCSN